MMSVFFIERPAEGREAYLKRGRALGASNE